MAEENIVEIDENEDELISQEEEEEEEELEELEGEGELEGEEIGEEAQGSEESSQMTASEDESSWITWFVNIRGNDFFCEIEESYIQDDFNLTGLSSQVPYYDYAIDMILDIDIPLGFLSIFSFLFKFKYISPLDNLNEEHHEIVETAAEVLYGLIHARYIVTSSGLNKMVLLYLFIYFL
jgi:casein kinase II subunit beta